MTALPRNGPVRVNDLHSGLNETVVSEVVAVRTRTDLVHAVERARASGRHVAVCGGRHAMGGQQFGTGAVLLDTRTFDRVHAFDPGAGTIEADAGIQWPALVAWLARAQAGAARQWSIRQKQTGADRLSLGGSLAANVHGRGLDLPPFAADVEDFTLVGADGAVRRCSRVENRRLFGLAIGGYGLFGVIDRVRLRLAPRTKLRRVVEIATADEAVPALEARAAAGFAYGDFQFAIDPASPDFLRLGVLSCYQPVAGDTPIPERQAALSEDDWRRLLVLAHTDKSEAFRRYAEFYLGTSGQIYWSDLAQMSFYSDQYHRGVDLALGHRGSEMITEIYVPRARLADFMAEAAADFRAHGTDVVYGTVRLIRRDAETFLPWAREDWACVIFNLHVEHADAAIARAAGAFRRLIDAAVRRGGSYYLTYHRWATREQVLACHPGFVDFLRAKRAHDPDGTFQSDWHRHYAAMFRSELARAEPRAA
ncbi:MAG: FAD-binding oxidoreductase [Burkholderiales bacterium]|nr:FAD-binding oxidoreductase [Burkholderiales bacterium]